jgi:hypothetical protein
MRPGRDHFSADSCADWEIPSKYSAGAATGERMRQSKARASLFGARIGPRERIDPDDYSLLGHPPSLRKACRAEVSRLSSWRSACSQPAIGT